MKFPVRYKRSEEVVEDADFLVVAMPHIERGRPREEIHIVGEAISAALNLAEIARTNRSVPGQPMVVSNGEFTLPESVRSQVVVFEMMKLNRIERKHRKMVSKLKAKYGAD